MRGRALALGGCMLAAFFVLGATAAVGGSPPTMQVSPSSHDFGILCAGVAATKTITITNTGSEGADPLEISSIQRSGSDRFTPASVNPPPPIAVNDSAPFVVTFTAPTHGTVSATYTVTSPNASDSPDSVTLKGRGVDRRLTADRAAVSFGEQRVDTRSPTQTLLIRNLGSDATTVTLARKSGALSGDFRVTAPATPFTVAPNGGYVTVTVAFQPKAAGLRQAGFELTSNACSGSKLKVSLVGTGVVPNVAVDPNPVDAGSSPVDTQGPPVPVTVTNSGGAPLKITAIQVLGDDAADFILEGLPTMPATVPAGESFIFNVRMTPSKEGALVGSINVLSDDPDTPTLTVDLRGTGGKAAPSASPSATASATPSRSASPTVTTTTTPRAASSSNDNLAIILVIVAVVLAFLALIVVRRFIAAPEDDE